MIRDIEELDFPKKEGEETSYATLSHATVNLPDMGEKTITSSVRIDGEIAPDFSRDWAVVYDGEKYIMPLRKPPANKGNTSLNSTVDLTFRHWVAYQLQRWPIFTLPPGESSTAVPDKYIASVSLNLVDFIKMYAIVIEYYYGDSIKIALSEEAAAKSAKDAIVVELDHTSMWDVLVKLYNLYAVRWEIVPDGDIDHYIIKVGYGATEVGHILEYGFEGGLLNVERQVQNDKIRNMLLGRGGSKNLPLRYFKDVDPNNPSFPADPDWIPELRNMPFTELRSKEFRDYVKGWKTNPKRQLTESDGAPIKPYGSDTPIAVESYNETYAAANYAYMRGHTDDKFDPIEYVRDEQSILRYGPLLGNLANNEKVYPSIQGRSIEGLGRIDEVVDVEQMTKDSDIAAVAENKAQTTNLSPSVKRATNTLKGSKVKQQTDRIVKVTISAGNFIVSPGKRGNLSVEGAGGKVAKVKNGRRRDVDAGDYTTSYRLIVRDNTSAQVSASGLPEGVYSYAVEVSIQLAQAIIDDNADYNFTASFEGAFLDQAEVGAVKGQTFDVWIKNVWDSQRRAGETDTAYVERVWNQILGDSDGSEAKVVFASGELAVSEDYEFAIAQGGIHFDDSKSLDGVASHWRLTLIKSDADLESTGLYVPSQMRNGHAGDLFVFTGIELTHQYVLLAEKALQDYKIEGLDKVKDIASTWVVTPDRVRFGNEGRADALIDQIKPGCSVRLADKRFITDSPYETLYVQSVTYTYREPTSEDPALNPDVDIVLGDDYAVAAPSTMEVMQGDINALSRQVGSIGNIEQLIRVVGDKLYLRKDGINDRSISPTEFANILSSYGFRQGMIGGRGWGFSRDANGNWGLELDWLKVRNDFEVSTLVVSQIVGRGGMIVESAASMEISYVEQVGSNFKCYFDQKGGSVWNLFKMDDVAMCHRFCPATDDTSVNAAAYEKFYKRKVLGVGENYVILDGMVNVVGSGVPAEGDVIVQYGNYTDENRRFVIVRDVVGGGYERFIEGLDSVESDGEEYFFVGRQAGTYDKPRFYIGNSQYYIEFKNGKLRIKADIDIESTFGGKTFAEVIASEVGELKGYALVADAEITPINCDSDGQPVGGGSAPGVIPVIASNTFALIGPDGQELDALNWTLTTKGGSGLTLGALSFSPKGVTISSMSVNSSTLTVCAVVNGEEVATIDWVLYKVIPGADGTAGTNGTDGQNAVGYSILTSVDAVIRSFDDSLNPTSITVTTYKADGDSAPQPTNFGRLECVIEGTGQTNNIARLYGVATVTVPATARRLVFTLYDGTTPVARKTVAVLYDAEGAAEQMRNHALRTSVPFRVSDFTSAVHTYPLYEIEGITGGDDITVSFDYDFIDITYGTNAYIAIQLRVGNEYITPTKAYHPPLINGRGLHHSFTYPIPASAVGGSSEEYPDQVRLSISGCTGGTIVIRNMIVQRSKKEAPWSPNPNDPNYLIKALQGSTTISGGLVLTSVVEVGNSDSGVYTVRAGMSGIDMPAHAHGGVVFWGGGTYEQAGQGNSTYVIYMDGTGHAAGGTIKFLGNKLQVGEYINLSNSGLDMTISGEQKLQIGNIDVADKTKYIMNATYESKMEAKQLPASPSTFSYIRNTMGNLMLYIDESYVGTGVENGYSFNHNIGYLPANTKITIGTCVAEINCATRPAFSAINPYGVPKVTARLYNGSELLGTFGTPTPGYDSDGNITYTFTGMSLTTQKDCDNLIVRFTLYNNISRPDPELSGFVKDASTKAQFDLPDTIFTATIPTYNATRLGNNGLQFSWGNCHQYQTDNFWGVRAGAHGLQITNGDIRIYEPGTKGEWMGLRRWIAKIVADVIAGNISPTSLDLD